MKKKEENLTRRLTSIAEKKPAQSTGPALSRPKSRDRRKEPREAVFRPGKVYISKRNFLRCVIRDLSPAGARIRIEGVDRLPDILVLKFDQTGVIMRAKLAWQDEHEAGLMYLGPAK